MGFFSRIKKRVKSIASRVKTAVSRRKSRAASKFKPPSKSLRAAPRIKVSSARATSKPGTAKSVIAGIDKAKKSQLPKTKLSSRSTSSGGTGGSRSSTSSFRGSGATGSFAPPTILEKLGGAIKDQLSEEARAFGFAPLREGEQFFASAGFGGGAPTFAVRGAKALSKGVLGTKIIAGIRGRSSGKGLVEAGKKFNAQRESLKIKAEFAARKAARATAGAVARLTREATEKVGVQVGTRIRVGATVKRRSIIDNAVTQHLRNIGDINIKNPITGEVYTTTVKDILRTNKKAALVIGGIVAFAGTVLANKVFGMWAKSDAVESLRFEKKGARKAAIDMGLVAETYPQYLEYRELERAAANTPIGIILGAYTGNKLKADTALDIIRIEDSIFRDREEARITGIDHNTLADQKERTSKQLQNKDFNDSAIARAEEIRKIEIEGEIIKNQNFNVQSLFGERQKLALRAKFNAEERRLALAHEKKMIKLETEAREANGKFWIDYRIALAEMQLQEEIDSWDDGFSSLGFGLV